MNQLFFILSLWLQLGEQTKKHQEWSGGEEKKKPLFLQALNPLFLHTPLSGRKGYIFQSAAVGGESPILQRGTSTSQTLGLAGEGGIYSSPCTNLNCNPRKTVSSQSGFLNKNKIKTQPCISGL